ncbi:clasp N terminal-domain-containing protein [Aspergillus unguis]
MEKRASTTAAVLRDKEASVDAKVTQILGLKSEIKQKNVPDTAVPSIFESLRLCICSKHVSLSLAGFSTFGHFWKRLILQGIVWSFDPLVDAIAAAVAARLSDQNDRVRNAASETMYNLQHSDGPGFQIAIENCLKLALAGDPNSRIAALNQIFWTSQTADSVLDETVPALIGNLKYFNPDLPDAAAEVRTYAFEALIRLFRHNSPHLKRHLKTQLERAGIQESTAIDLLVKIGLSQDTFVFRAHSAGVPSVAPPAASTSLRDRSQRVPSWARDAPAKTESSAPSTTSVASEPQIAANERASVDENSRNVTVIVKAPPAVDNEPASIISTSKQAVDESTKDAPVDAFVAASTDIASNEAPVIAPVDPADIKISPPITAEAPKPEAPKSQKVTRHPVTATSAESRAARPTPAAVAAAEPKVARSTPATTTAVELKTARPTSVTAPGIEPRNVTSRHELEQLVNSLLPCFEGKETDRNWQRREQNVVMLRRITHGNAPHDFNTAYLTIMKATTMLDNIFKVALSPRTNMQTAGLAMVQSLAQVNGPALDSVLDILMTNTLSLCGNTKKITAANGRKTVTIILENLTCSSRVVFHIAGAALSGNTNLRLFSAEWFQIIIARQAGHKFAGDALERMELSIKNGVSDSKEDIRVAYRATFWDFHKVWPDKATQIMNTLQPKHKQMIEKHAGNPMKDPFVSSSNTVSSGLFRNTPGRPAARGTTTTASTARGTTVPTRPTRIHNTATNTATNTSSNSAINSAAQPAHSVHAETTETNRPRKKLRPAVTGTGTGTPTSSLASAPMRPNATRPRVPQLNPTARPATAAGLHRRQPMESPNRGSPTRIPAASSRVTPKTSSQGITRPRQKSDPLQDASPTKLTQRNIEHVQPDELTPDRPFGTLNIPKKRRSNNYDEERAFARAGTDEASTSVADRIASQSWPVQEPEPASQQIPAETAAQGIEKDEENEENVKPKEEEHHGEESVEANDDAVLQLLRNKNLETKNEEQDGDVSDDENDDLILERLRSNDSASRGRAATDAPTPAWVHPPKMNISVRSQDLVQARRMLASAIEKIQKRDMELGGYRKLQGLIEFHKEELTDDKAQFAALLTALLDELENGKPHGQMKKNVTEWDHKTQVLYTVKYMFTYMREQFWAHNSETVVKLLKVQKPEAHRHFSNTIEQTIDEIVEVCEGEPMIIAILDAFGDQAQMDGQFQALQKGLDVIAHSMTYINGAKRTLSDQVLKRIGKLAGDSLQTGSTPLKRRVMAVYIEMRAMVVDEEKYWAFLGAPAPGMKALLTYYETKRHV